MKRLITLVCFISLLLCSCSSSDSSSPSSAEDDVLVKEVLPADGTGLIHFIYNGKKIVSASHPNEDRNYTYTGNLITRIQTFNNGNGLGYGLRMDELFTYDTSGRLTEHIFKAMEDGINVDFTITNTFVYNSNNTVSTTETMAYPTSGISYIDKTKLLHLSGGRVISEDVLIYDYATGSIESSYTLHYNYDTKNNPFKNIIGYNEISLAEEWVFSFEHLHYLHNILSVQELSGSSGMTVTYSYNGLNFPLTPAINTPSESGFGFEPAIYTYY